MTDLSSLLERATADVMPAPDLLPRVRRGGHRRRRRLQIDVAVLVVLVLVGGVLSVPRLRIGTSRPIVGLSGTLFDGHTHGDLAGDKAYVASVIKVWKASHEASGNASRGIFDDLRGDPIVVWAGTTPAGPAAVVAQDAYLHHHDGLGVAHEGVRQLLGFFGPGAGGDPRLVDDTYPTDPGDGLNESAWFVDQQRTVLAAVDDDQPVGYSLQWRYSSDGAAARDYTPLVDHDGVGLATVPPQNAYGVSVSRLPYVTLDDAIQIAGGLSPRTDLGSALDWTGHRVLPGGSTNAFVTVVHALDALRQGLSASLRGSRWWITAKLPDGDQVAVDEIGLDNDPSRLYAVVTHAAGGTTVIDSGPIDASASLPVKVHLPDGQGWIVARYGATLSYPGGPPAQDAMLVPEGTTQVTVQVGEGPVSVDL